MKRVIIVVLCLLGFPKAEAQHPYIPIPEDSAIWVSLLMSKQNNTAVRYYLGWTEGADTLLSGKKYACYFGELSNKDLPIPPPAQTPKKIAEWIRQDNSGKKVWLDKNHANPPDEWILYDFSVQKGDTLLDSTHIYFGPQFLYPYKAWVDDVDSIYWADGSWRYRWWIKSKYGINSTLEVVMIEGMGYTTHFMDDVLNVFTSESYYFRIGCFGVKGQWLYSTGNPWNADCKTMIDSNVVPVGIEDLHLGELSQPLLYPNPASSEGRLNFNHYAGLKHEVYEIVVYNAIGQKAFVTAIKPGDSISLNNYNLNRGVYFFIITNRAQQIIYKQKIMIQ